MGKKSLVSPGPQLPCHSHGPLLRAREAHAQPRKRLTHPQAGGCSPMSKMLGHRVPCPRNPSCRPGRSSSAPRRRRHRDATQFPLHPGPRFLRFLTRTSLTRGTDGRDEPCPSRHVRRMKPHTSLLCMRRSPKRPLLAPGRMRCSKGAEAVKGTRSPRGQRKEP